MKPINWVLTLTVVLGLLLVNSVTLAQEEELKKAKKFFSTAGVPGDKWIEGETMYPHVQPARHFNATMLYYPGTETLQANEVRVIFMGSTYYPNLSQSGMSILVELGNGDRFVFDLGIGSLRNYNAFSIPFNTINHVFFTHLHMDHMSDLPYFTMFRPIQGGWDAVAHLWPERLRTAVRYRPHGRAHDEDDRLAPGQL